MKAEKKKSIYESEKVANRQEKTVDIRGEVLQPRRWMLGRHYRKSKSGVYSFTAGEDADLV